MLLKANDDNVRLGIFSCVQELTIVQQVEELAAIDLVESNMHAEMAVILVSQALKQVTGGQEENSRGTFAVRHALYLPLVRPHHREGLAAACLPISEACALGALEDGINHRPYTRVVQLLVGDVIVEGLIKQEVVLFDIACEVHLELRLPYNDSAVPANHDILLLCLLLPPIHGPLSNDNAQPGIPCARCVPRCLATRRSGSAGGPRQEKAAAILSCACPGIRRTGAVGAGVRALEAER
mmetsp:Transcript_98463/g.246720  ORF Transcript_98463/g.246720 Transcript_98463/m.246720 type:complete len:239 (+) Transcript_98463:546-1262(+)